MREYWIVDPGSGQIMVYLFEKGDLPGVFGRNDKVPLYISGGTCVIDFKEVFDEVESLPDEE